MSKLVIWGSSWGSDLIGITIQAHRANGKLDGFIVEAEAEIEACSEQLVAAQRVIVYVTTTTTTTANDNDNDNDDNDHDNHARGLGGHGLPPDRDPARGRRAAGGARGPGPGL